MPLVRHTPPCKLSRPSRVPSDVAEDKNRGGSQGSSPAPPPPPALREHAGAQWWFLGSSFSTLRPGDTICPCPPPGSTNDVVIVVGPELMAPEVRAVLLELDGEAKVQVWPVTGEKKVRGRGCLTAPTLGTPY